MVKLDVEDEYGDTEELRHARPADDRLRMDAARERAERALFRTAEPTLIGRYVLLDILGTGGMGVVYRAYDPQLDRKVALKLIHPRAIDDRQARDRLINEGRALARLEHANIVPVYDVVEKGDQIVVVMELVEGETLNHWQVTRRGQWRELIAVYAAAGRGLAAAHALGLVHRDFKPANVIVGNDGRVRVLDFGLVLVVAGADQPVVVTAMPAPAVTSGGLTATGAVVGTPAYMAPEQLEAGVTTAAADQFSFCVALYEALYGVRPFPGDSVEQLVAAIQARRLTAPASSRPVPGWLRALVVRGLEPAPAARHASMAPLLAELERERGWRRWRWPLVAAVLVAVAAAAIILPRQQDPLAACDGGIDEISTAWGLGAAMRVRALLLAAQTPDTVGQADQVVDGLDRYRGGWVDAHRSSCRARVRRGLSDDSSRRRTRCLASRRVDLANAADVLVRMDRTNVSRALEVVSGLPPIAWCTNDSVLEATSEPPTSVATAVSVEALRGTLSAAAAEEHAGRSSHALAMASAALAEAETVGYPPVAIEAGLIVGRLRLFREEFTEAVPVLLAAERLALEEGLDSSAVIAFARRLYAAGRLERDIPRLLIQLEVFESLSESLDGDHFARPLLLSNAGTVQRELGDRAAARRYFAAAHDAVAGEHEPDLELTAIDLNIAMDTEDADQRMALTRGVWQHRQELLGPPHPLTLQALSFYVLAIPDPAVALPLADDLCQRYARAQPDLLAIRVECEYLRAFLTAETGATVAAATRYREVATLARSAKIDDTAELAEGHSLLAGGDGPAALARFAAVVATYAGSTHLGERVVAADARLGSAMAERALGRGGDARAHLEIAEQAFADACAVTENAEFQRRLALTRLNLAGVLAEQGDPDQRQRALLHQATAFYRAAGPSTYRWRLEPRGK